MKILYLKNPIARIRRIVETVAQATVAVGIIGVAGCGNNVTVQPSDATMVGLWIPDRTKSTCPTNLFSSATKLALKDNKTFQAVSFPKELSLGRQPEVIGKWSLRKTDNAWRLDLPWETPSKSILDGAALARHGREIYIELWIGDPDAGSRLVLRKQASP